MKKTLSNRNRVNEGPMSDCVAYSISIIDSLFGMRLRVKGEFQEESVACLFNTIPKVTITSEALCTTFYRGNDKMPLFDSISKK